MSKEYAKNIIRLRAKLGLKQSDLAELLEVSTATINRWENGHNEPLNIQKIRLDDLFELHGIGGKK